MFSLIWCCVHLLPLQLCWFSHTFSAGRPSLCLPPTGHQHTHTCARHAHPTRPPRQKVRHSENFKSFKTILLSFPIRRQPSKHLERHLRRCASSKHVSLISKHEACCTLDASCAASLHKSMNVALAWQRSGRWVGTGTQRTSHPVCASLSTQRGRAVRHRVHKDKISAENPPRDTCSFE